MFSAMQRRRGSHHMKDSAACRILLARQYPIATVRCGHCRRRCLYLRVSHLSAGTSKPTPQSLTHHERSSRRRSVRRRLGSSCGQCSARHLSRPAPSHQTHPRVKTLSRDVLPHAPSPLCRGIVVSAHPRTTMIRTQIIPPQVR